MADQLINQLPKKTAPTTGDAMLMIGASEEYQIDYDKLADAILNKLTSKTFALSQGTKSLVAALNELNSKIEIKEIKTGNDLNDFTESGIFKCSASSITETLKNAPEMKASGFSLVVIKCGSGVNQLALYINGSVYVRGRSSTMWFDWKEL